MSEYLTKIKQIISKRTGLENDEISVEKYLEDDLNIGEMELLDILTDVEEEFKVEISNEESEINTVSDILTIVSEGLE